MKLIPLTEENVTTLKVGDKLKMRSFSNPTYDGLYNIIKFRFDMEDRKYFVITNQDNKYNTLFSPYHFFNDDSWVKECFIVQEEECLTKEKQIEIFKKIQDQITIQQIQEKLDEVIDLLLKKGDDYAGQEDRMRVFKGVAEMTQTSSESVVLQLIATKVMRLSNLLNGSSTNFESKKDSKQDLLGYVLLLMCLDNDN